MFQRIRNRAVHHEPRFEGVIVPKTNRFMPLSEVWEQSIELLEWMCQDLAAEVDVFDGQGEVLLGVVPYLSQTGQTGVGALDSAGGPPESESATSLLADDAAIFGGIGAGLRMCCTTLP